MSQLPGRLRQENCLNLGGGRCSEPRSHYCTPAWVTERLRLKKKNKQTKDLARHGGSKPIIPALCEAEVSRS